MKRVWTFGLLKFGIFLYDNGTKALFSYWRKYFNKWTNEGINVPLVIRSGTHTCNISIVNTTLLTFKNKQNIILNSLAFWLNKIVPQWIWEKNYYKLCNWNFFGHCSEFHYYNSDGFFQIWLNPPGEKLIHETLLKAEVWMNYKRIYNSTVRNKSPFIFYLHLIMTVTVLLNK